MSDRAVEERAIHIQNRKVGKTLTIRNDEYTSAAGE
jgi:hypothetical protein